MWHCIFCPRKFMNYDVHPHQNNPNLWCSPTSEQSNATYQMFCSQRPTERINIKCLAYRYGAGPTIHNKIIPAFPYLGLFRLNLTKFRIADGPPITFYRPALNPSHTQCNNYDVQCIWFLQLFQFISAGLLGQGRPIQWFFQFLQCPQFPHLLQYFN